MEHYTALIKCHNILPCPHRAPVSVLDGAVEVGAGAGGHRHVAGGLARDEPGEDHDDTDDNDDDTDDNDDDDSGEPGLAGVQGVLVEEVVIRVSRSRHRGFCRDQTC